MNSQPLVSVICLCYNQEKFVKDAINSVLNQTYSNVQLIIVDDASTDNSRFVIEQVISKYPAVIYLPLERNHDNCAAFNLGLARAKGEFIIDLAADDILCANRISEGIRAFQKVDSSYGVNFSNAITIDEAGEYVTHHYAIDDHGRAVDQIPEHDVFGEVIRRYFICPPTVMFKREVIDQLGGYDESLTYEDFDFWVRSSRSYKYVFTDAVLVKKRIVKGSKSAKQFRIWSDDLVTTFMVCRKAGKLIRNRREKEILKKRILYEIKQSLRFLSFRLAWNYLKLLQGLKANSN